MVKSNLEIFDPIREYLLDAIKNCPNGLTGCSTSNSLRKYYDQQYYRSNPDNLKYTDMPKEFTKRALQVAVNLSKLDRSSTPGTLLGSVLTTADSFAVKNKDLRGGIANIIDLEQTSQVGGAPFVATKLIGSYCDDYLKGLTSEIKKVYNQFGGFRKANKEIIGTIEELDVLLHNDIKQQLTNSLEKRYYKNYLIGGDSSDVKRVLKVLVDGQVDTGDIDLFNHFIMIMELPSSDVTDPTGNWRFIGPVQYQGFTLNPKHQYRLNLKRVMATTPTSYGIGHHVLAAPLGNMLNLEKGRTPFLIEDFIPLSSGGLIQDPAGGPHNNPDWLQVNFNDLIHNGAVPPTWNLKTTGTLTSVLNCDEIIRNEISKTAMDNEEMTMDDPYKVNPAITRNGWVKLDDGNYEKTLKDGTKVVYKNGDDEYNKLFTKANRCFSAQLNMSEVDCCAWMDAVLKGNSQELLKFVHTHSINFITDPKNINKAHPLLVLKVLKAFGFREELVYDMATPGGFNGKIWKIQTVNKWRTKYLEKKFTPVHVKNIMGNKHLLIYLGLLVDYVNANPSLINEGMVKSTGANLQPIQVPEEFSKRGVIPCIVPSKKNKTSTDWNELTKNINNIYGNFYNGLNFKSQLPFGMNNLFPYTQTWGVGNVYRGSTLHGGASDGKQEVFIDLKETRPQFTHQVATQIHTLLEKLKSLNKPLKKSDTERILQKLTDFSNLETELYNTILMINKYSQLASIFNKDGSREVVSLETMHNYVNRYTPLVDKYENTKTGLEGLLTILKEINDDDDDDVNVSVLKTRPISL
jgi:hypothetical protein